MTVEPGLPPPQTPPDPPPTSFERGLASVLGRSRNERDLSDERFAMIVIGFLHSYVQSPAVKAAAEAAVAKLDQPSPSECVEAVIGSIMEVRL